MPRWSVPAEVHGRERFLLRRRNFTPAYLKTHAEGRLQDKVEEALAHLGPSCQVCPRLCKGVDRRADQFGVCKVVRHARVASAFPHFGEEDMLRGWEGSGTIFFSWCNLRCVYCQNFEVSQAPAGEELDAVGLARVTRERVGDGLIGNTSRGEHSYDGEEPLTSARMSCMILLLSGLSSTGKSAFGAYLSTKHGFFHFDMEKPDGWPLPDLHSVWESSRHAFVARLKASSRPVVLDWGFPPSCLPWVLELKSCDVRVVWFKGDVELCRKHYRERNQKRGFSPDFAMIDFERQARAINASGLPGNHGFEVVQAFDTEGGIRSLKDPESLVNAILRK